MDTGSATRRLCIEFSAMGSFSTPPSRPSLVPLPSPDSPAEIFLRGHTALLPLASTAELNMMRYEMATMSMYNLAPLRREGPRLPRRPRQVPGGRKPR